MRVIVEGDIKKVYCPACKELHAIGAGWTYNGNDEFPTMGPCSVVVRLADSASGRARYCHFWLKEGHFDYVGSSHRMNGMYVRVPEIPEEYFKEPEEVEL